VAGGFCGAGNDVHGFSRRVRVRLRVRVRVRVRGCSEGMMCVCI